MLYFPSINSYVPIFILIKLAGEAAYRFKPLLVFNSILKTYSSSLTKLSMAERLSLMAELKIV
jgi:hypothetical protein